MAVETKQPQSLQPQTIPDRPPRAPLPASGRPRGASPRGDRAPWGGHPGSGGLQRSGTARPRAARGSRLPAERPGRGSARGGSGLGPLRGAAGGWGEAAAPPGVVAETGLVRSKEVDAVRSPSAVIRASGAEFVAACFGAEVSWILRWIS